VLSGEAVGEGNYTDKETPCVSKVEETFEPIIVLFQVPKQEQTSSKASENLSNAQLFPSMIYHMLSSKQQRRR
jgi:hypothetical protein